MVRKLFILCCFPMLGCRCAYGSEQVSPNKPSSEEIPAIEEININVHPVFDESNPKENNMFFRLINRLHIDTKKHVVEKDLTFKQGDALDKHLLEESERRLRERRYFAQAKITAEPVDENADKPNQQINVDVREVWTLIPKISYSNAGGNSHYGYGLHDSNFLGLGKTVKIERESTEARTSTSLAYRDPNFAGEKQLALLYSDNSDGKAQEFHLSNPFRSIRTPWTAGIDVQDFEREDTLYNAGDEAWRFGHMGTYYSLFYGQRLNSSTDDRTHRWTLGWDNVVDDFYSVPLAENSTLGVLPENRNYNVAWLEYAYQHNRFFEATNIQQINRVEDINLGSEWRVRIGSVMADDEQLDKSTMIQFDYSKAYRLSPNQLFTGKISTSGFYTGQQSLHSISKVDLTYHWQNVDRGQFYIYANETYGNHLFADMPLELGGDTGLRGYPARFMAGDHSRLFTVEQRYFGETEWFSLFHVGAAIFYDQGKVWGETNIPQTYQQTLRDVGIGLRISGTRTGGRDDGAHNIAHIDLAYPLDGSNDIDKYQISVKIKTGF